MTNYKLIDADTFVELKRGDKRKTSKGEWFILNSWKAPHKPSSSGFVYGALIQNEDDDYSLCPQQEFYASVINARFAKETSEGWIVKSRYVPGNGVQAEGEYVLVNLENNDITPWVVWFHNFQDGGFHSGDYCNTIEKAKEAFEKRSAWLK